VTDGTASPGGATRRLGLGAAVYIALVMAFGLGLTAVAVRAQGVPTGTTLAVLVLLAVLTWWSGPFVDDGRVRLTFSSVVLLSAMALLGPAGAGIVGIILGPLQPGEVPLRARLFNTGQSATLGVLGGAAYLAAGGSTDAAGLVGAHEILLHVGWPLLVADLVQEVVNLGLFAGIVRMTDGVPMRAQIGRLVAGTGAAYLGYGVVAFLLVVLWQPAGVGPGAAVLVLAPLLVARWAYRQYGEEAAAQQRALHVLVAAVEVKAPHLAGHSARVAELGVAMAEHLGLRPQSVEDTRLAGTLHDVGQTTLPTSVVRGLGDVPGSDLDSYPERGAALLRELSFLSGALEPIARHRSSLGGGGPGAAADLPSRIVGVADEFDLLTEVGSPDGRVSSRAEALARLRDDGVDTELLAALESALARRAAIGTAG
jgi:hypothetical protein